MFKSIAQFFRSIIYAITGRIDESRKAIDSDPHVIRARYDGILREKTKQIQQYKQAVAALITQQEKKLAKLKELTDESGKLEKLKAGALAKAKKVVATLQAAGKEMSEIKTDSEYQRCQSAYKDFTSTVEEKQQRIADLEADVEGYDKNIKEHKNQLTELLRDLEKIKSEAADTVADVLSAKQEKEIADTVAGIGEDSTQEELQRMRDLRENVKAEARVSKELAGTDNRKQEAEFLDFAEADDSDSEFEALLGIAEEKETASSPVVEKEQKVNLPE